jgi:hypothetical protein
MSILIESSRLPPWVLVDGKLSMQWSCSLFFQWYCRSSIRSAISTGFHRMSSHYSAAIFYSALGTYSQRKTRWVYGRARIAGLQLYQPTGPWNSNHIGEFASRSPSLACGTAEIKTIWYNILRYWDFLNFFWIFINLQAIRYMSSLWSIFPWDM